MTAYLLILFLSLGEAGGPTVHIFRNRTDCEEAGSKALEMISVTPQGAGRYVCVELETREARR
jgi:hypothetical protein